MSNHARRLSLVAGLVALSLPSPAVAQVSARAPSAGSAVLDDSVPPGDNYDKAQFRFWAPPGTDRLQGTLVLVPGSNGDGRAMAQDSVWQAFAARHNLAIVACRFTDKPHDQSFIESYVNVSQGSGQALLTAMSRLASRAHHPELDAAPLVFWGMSAGGQFNYEFVAWKPERVAAFVVNKGGIYYSALLSRAAREVPGILFIGGKDLEFRTNTIVGLFAVNRRGGALWALAEEPGVAHVVGQSRDLSIVFFDDVLPMRMGNGGTLRALDEKSGFIGDLKAKVFQPAASGPAPTLPTAWLPTARVARAWQAMLMGTP
jgi:poly(3-hydroxybutyrate) depolymerase